MHHLLQTAVLDAVEISAIYETRQSSDMAAVLGQRTHEHDSTVPCKIGPRSFREISSQSLTVCN